jgi:hypothetical protein
VPDNANMHLRRLQAPQHGLLLQLHLLLVPEGGVHAERDRLTAGGIEIYLARHRPVAT